MGGSKQKQNIILMKGAGELRSRATRWLRERLNVHASGCNWRICREQWEQLSGCPQGTRLLQLEAGSMEQGPWNIRRMAEGHERSSGASNSAVHLCSHSCGSLSGDGESHVVREARTDRAARVLLCSVQQSDVRDHKAR